MTIRPQVPAAGVVQVPLAILNEAGTEPLIIRRGDVMATIRRIPDDSIFHSNQAVWAPSIDAEKESPSTGEQAQQPETIAAAVNSPQQEANEAAEETRNKEKSVIWSMIHDKSGTQIVKLVKDGAQIGTVTFGQWKQAVQQDLKFGPRISAQLKEDLTCLLYALRLVVAKDPKKPGVMKGFEGTITLVDPATAPVKCKHRRYTPKECEIIKQEVSELYANGMIEQSDSSWSTPVVLVKKKAGN